MVRTTKTEGKHKTPKRAKQYSLKEIEKRRAEETVLVFANLEQEETTGERAEEKSACARMSRNETGENQTITVKKTGSE